jgi:hypothetical protein
MNGAPGVDALSVCNQCFQGRHLLLKFVDSLTVRVLLKKELANVVVVVDNCILGQEHQQLSHNDW